MEDDPTEVAHLKELMLRMFEARDKAIDLARMTMNTRLDGMNQFRDQLKEQASKFTSRDEHEFLRTLIDKNDNKITLLMTRIAALESKLYIGGAGVIALLSVIQLILYQHVAN